MSGGTKRGGRFGRRKFLKAIGVGGIATAGLRRVPGVGTADNHVRYLKAWGFADRETAVEAGEEPEFEPVYDSVSRWRYLDTSAASNAALELQRTLNREVDEPVQVVFTSENDERLLKVSRVQREHPGSDQGEDRSQSNNDEAQAIEKIEGSVPSNVTGTARVGKVEEGYLGRRAVEASDTYTGGDVEWEWGTYSYPTNVTVEKYMDLSDGVSTRKQGPLAEYERQYDPVPGGCHIQTWTDGALPRSGTTGTPAWDHDHSEWVMVTAGHNFAKLPGGNGEAHQPIIPEPKSDKRNKIGDSDKVIDKRGSPFVFDAATIRLDDGIETRKALAGEQANEYQEDIAGYLTWATIEANEGNTDFAVHKQGQETGRTSGHIQAVGPAPSVFTASTRAGVGDSGGPIFTKTREGSSEVLVAGIVSRGPNKISSDPPRSSNAQGSSMDSKHDQLEEPLNSGIAAAFNLAPSPDREGGQVVVESFEDQDFSDTFREVKSTVRPYQMTYRSPKITAAHSFSGDYGLRMDPKNIESGDRTIRSIVRTRETWTGTNRFSIKIKPITAPRGWAYIHFGLVDAQNPMNPIFVSSSRFLNPSVYLFDRRPGRTFQAFGPPLPRGEWSEVSIDVTNGQIVCRANGNQISRITDWSSKDVRIELQVARMARRDVAFDDFDVEQLGPA